MKRYWKLTTLTIFIVLVIGMFFIQSTLATRHLPNFVITHQSGDQAEAKPLTIFGDYIVDGETYIWTEITDEGTSYRKNESSYLYLLKGGYFSPEIKQLQNDYRKFMRGKQGDQIASFFEDENILAYVELRSEFLYTHGGMWDYSFVVEILDKKSNNTTNFQLDIPEVENYNYLYIEGIQLIDGQIRVMTVNDYTTDDDYHSRQDMHIYTVDMDTQKIVNDVSVGTATTDLESNQWYSISGVHRDGNIGPIKYFVFSREKNEETFNGEYYDYQTIERQYVVYNLQTDEQEDIDFSKEFGGVVEPQLLRGSTIYLSKETDNQLEIIAYDLEEKQIETTHSFAIPTNSGEGQFKQISFKEDKIYMMWQLDQGKVDSKIMIADLNTGEMLYEGIVEMATTSKDQQEDKMYINEMRVNKE